MHEKMGSQENNRNKAPYDLSEEASKRGGDEEATQIARREESDDVGFGQTDSPEGDEIAENRVTTTISED